MFRNRMQEKGQGEKVEGGRVRDGGREEEREVGVDGEEEASAEEGRREEVGEGREGGRM